MSGIIGLLKMLYHRNKLFFVIAIVVIAIFIAGCSTQGTPAPSGPVGGGCGI